GAERLGEVAARPEEERLDRGLAEAEATADLRVRQPVPFAEQQRTALCGGERGERVAEGGEILARRVAAAGDVVQPVDVDRRLDPASPPERAATGAADVVRDRVQPGQLASRRLAPLEQRERVEERRLHRVVGFLAVAELAEAVGVDARAVPAEEGRGELARAGVGAQRDVRQARLRLGGNGDARQLRWASIGPGLPSR